MTAGREDRVRDVIHNFNADGFSFSYPTYKGGRPPKFTLVARREIKKICDNFSPHLTTRKDKRAGQWSAANSTEIAHTPANSSWLTRAAPRDLAKPWSTGHAYDERLRRIIDRADVA